VKTRLDNWKSQQRWSKLSRQVVRQVVRKKPGEKKHPQAPQKPVAFFNASSRIGAVSLNAAFSFITSSSLALSGVPVAHFACKAGMSRCIMGTSKDDPYQAMPCQSCISLSSRLFSNALSLPFTYQQSPQLADLTLEMSVAELSGLAYPAPFPLALSHSTTPDIPLGRLVLPGLRWVLRKHDLDEDEPTRFLMREFILSAYHVAREFNDFLNQVDPQSLIVFNGIMYPEAVARWLAQQRGLRTITHEVGFNKFSAFFTNGDATAYPIDIPADFQLSKAQNAQLDAYLEQRFQGEFTMAGIQFWPEIHQLDKAFLEKAATYRQVVPVFTNVVYDTSQIHANVIFPHMFAWLDQVLEIIKEHPETLFVIRAHPDEMRPGTAKQSRQTVQQWVVTHEVQKLPNVIFIDSQEYVSSYELILRSKFILVYNSSIGLEAALLGKPVLCGGKARYITTLETPTSNSFHDSKQRSSSERNSRLAHQLEPFWDCSQPNGRIVYFPCNQQEFYYQAESFLAADTLLLPEEFRQNARRFLYYQLYRASLPFDQYLETGARPGFVKLKNIHWSQLLPQNDRTMQVLTNGILEDKPFLMPAEMEVTQNN
jgi:hypothetical protein